MRPLVFWALAVFALDQVSKYIVVQVLDLYSRHEIEVLPPWINFRMAWNQGVNFGLFASSGDAARWILIGLSLVISVWVFLWARRERGNRITQASAGALIGGALGNVCDRLAYGAVADFLNMSVPGVYNPFSFNVADVAIFAGAFGLVIFSGRDKTP